MKKITAILFVTSALTSQAAFAGGPGADDPFFWVDGGGDAPAQTTVTPATANKQALPKATRTQQAKPAAVPLPRPEIQTGSKAADVGADGVKKAPASPLLKDYPAADAPKNGAPENGRARYDNGNCDYSDRTPATLDFSRKGSKSGEAAKSGDAYQARAGYMTGDNGVLGAIQDDPCADIRRRGGETADSASGYVNPDDIRRANSLEDHRIPVHSVGRYTPEGSGKWSRTPDNPYVDAASEWKVTKGLQLSQMLETWGKRAGYTVIYQASHDFMIEADVIIQGTFPEAAGQVVESYADADPPIAADLYPDNKVLVVRSAAEFDGR